MHLVHCTSAASSMRVLTERALKPTKCPVYGTDLLYLFYGRPAYKPGQGIVASGLLELAPVCLILDPAVLASAVRILPFDSGGFSRYSNLLGPGLQMPEFELGRDASAPMRLVHAFYETNSNYYEQKPTLRGDTLPLSKLAARGYARLIGDVSIRDVDDRCGTVEVQFDAPIGLASALKAIVGPTAMFDDPDVQAVLAECPDAVPLTYKIYGRTEASILAQSVYEKVETFLANEGVFG